jgi:hypothetical protein
VAGEGAGLGVVLAAELVGDGLRPELDAHAVGGPADGVRGDGRGEDEERDAGEGARRHPALAVQQRDRDEERARPEGSGLRGRVHPQDEVGEADEAERGHEHEPGAERR